MALIPVEEALDRILAGASFLDGESVAISQAAGRVLADPLTALRTQPPFPASAMDGYAVRAADIAKVPAVLRVIGTVPAGHGFAGTVGPGECVRIFTGAPVPEGADTVVIQENTDKTGDGLVCILQSDAAGRNIRAAGIDFREGELILAAGRMLDAAALSLAAAANHAQLDVIRRPMVAIIATGDELLPPGSVTGPGQIIASNSYGVAALARGAGADVLDLGIIPDDKALTAAAVQQALDGGADVIVTLGGASVGDHDHMQAVLTGMGMEPDFWKIALRPGKPLMVGRFGKVHVLGLPGNPVSSLVCSHLFLLPLLARLGGYPHSADMREAALSIAMAPNDNRQDYVRARLTRKDDGPLAVEPFARQDSSMLKTLAEAHCLIVRPPFAEAAPAGTLVPVLMLRTIQASRT